MTDHQVIKYDNATLATLRDTVAQGATDSELAMFVAMAKSTGLNPFKRELWFIKAGGRVQMMTGINGFHTIANNAPEYDGMETGLVGKQGEYLPLTHPTNDFIGAWARVYRKDRKVPSEGVVMLSEYDKGTGNWKSMKRVMILKCAESVALRKAFPQQLSGLYTSEEMPPEYSVDPVYEEVNPLTVADVQKARGEAPKAADPQGSPISYKVRYALPYKSNDIDCNAWRVKLKSSGFEPDTSCKPWEWEGSVEYPELAAFRVGESAPDDDLPPEWEEEVSDGNNQAQREMY